MVNRLLLREGEIAPFDLKGFRHLLVFVTNSGRMLEKEDLMKQVWTESFVEEGNLTRNVLNLVTCEIVGVLSSRNLLKTM